MSRSAFTITNSSDLQVDREVLPLAQRLLRALTSSGVVERFHRVDLSDPPFRDWVIFKDSDGGGFGIRLHDEGESASPLQRTLRFVRQAQATVTALGSPRTLPCVLTLERDPPPAWRVWELVGVAGKLWCAASNPIPQVPRGCVATRRDPKVRVRMYGVVQGGLEPQVGVEIECQTVDVWMPELGIRGRGVCGGEGMAIEIGECGETREPQVPGVRLDLGEVEMRLSDLVGLRPGVTINLGEVALERCFVRLGATVLAEGRFRTSNGQLLLTIESVL